MRRRRQKEMAAALVDIASDIGSRAAQVKIAAALRNSRGME